MSVDSKMTAIADAIRAKTGKTAALSLDAMATEIEGIVTEDILLPAEYPDYVRTEAQRVAEEVRKVLASDSVVSICMSDTHFYGNEGTWSSGVQNNEGCLHLAMAVKALAYLLPVDFIAHLGDVSNGANTTTPEVLKTQIKTFVSYLREGASTLPVFIAIGNHDPGIYYHNAQTDGAVHTLSGEWLYENFTKYSDSENTVFGGEEYGGYCYRDFEDKKLRVFLLNTSEQIVKSQSDSATLGSQRQWLANALLDLNSKDDAASWSFIVLCHYPADYGATMPLSELFKAYVVGGSISVTDENGSSSTFSFAGENKAKFAVQFHGHVHNFKTARLNSYASGSAAEYDTYRMCIPNGQYDRENYYSTVGSYTDISFAEDAMYSKTPDTAEDTSFVVNVYNPSENMIYSFHYGAGYDRVVSLEGIKYYSITKNLTYASIDNTAVSIKENGSYSANISINEGYELSSVSVTMGGNDITATAYDESTGIISISEVTGDIVITAEAIKQVNYTNLVPLSTDADGNIYNGTGYKDGYRISSSGSESAYTGFACTGFIPFTFGQTIRLDGEGITFAEYGALIMFYNESKTAIAEAGFNSGSFSSTASFETDTTEGTVITTKPIGKGHETAAFIRISAKGKGENMIVTIDEKIE